VNRVLDTNIVSYLLRDIDPVSQQFAQAANQGDQFFLSPVVDYEIRRYLDLKGARRSLDRYQSLVRSWTPSLLETPDWHRAAMLWAERHRRGLGIEDADLLIAVTALKEEAVLVSHNGSDFKELGLRIDDWLIPQTLFPPAS